MDTLDPAGEFLRIAGHYRQMSDDELQLLIPQSSELTPMAQQALATEARSRGLQTTVNPEAEAPRTSTRFEPRFERELPRFNNLRNDDPADTNDDFAEDDAADAESSYEEDRKLVELCTVWSVRDALKVQRILDVPGIPFFMGPEKATGVGDVTSNFSKGVVVQIMKIGLPWAWGAMRDYEPEDDPNPKEPEEPAELIVRCPKCRSTEVVFEGGTSTLIVPGDDTSQKLRWHCDACGHEWEDDGVAEEERTENRKQN
jgi:DNA-directed RNA polymerase subunit M/transcription elongation factor TFIIS